MSGEVNRDFVLFHLREAREELEQTIAEVTEDCEYDDAVFWVAMQHLYHHVNSAWNGRHALPARATEVSAADFAMWSRFPTDIPMLE